MLCSIMDSVPVLLLISISIIAFNFVSALALQVVVTHVYPPVETSIAGIKMIRYQTYTDVHGNVVTCTKVYQMCIELSQIKRR